jgi:hypothetical protein
MARLQEVAGPSSGSSALEHRQFERYLCLDDGVLRLAVRPNLGNRPVILVDLSCGGMSLLMRDPLEPGTMVAVNLGGAGRASVGRQARVCHCQPHPIPVAAPWVTPPPRSVRLVRWLFGRPDPADQGQAYLVGCEFTQLLEENELKMVLAWLGIPYEGL